MTQTKPTPFAEHDGTLYVVASDCGMHPLVIAIDGLPLTFFGDDRRRAYLTVDAAIAWHTKELAETCGRSGNAKAIEALRTAKAKHEAGKVVMQ